MLRRNANMKGKDMRKLLTLSALALALGGLGSVAAQAQEPVRAPVVHRHVLADMRQAPRNDHRRVELYSSLGNGPLASDRAGYAESQNAQYLFGNPEDNTGD
jgi:hypothetical protein